VGKNHPVNRTGEKDLLCRIIYLVSTYRRSRKELPELCIDTVFPDRMQQYCDTAGRQVWQRIVFWLFAII